MNYLLILKMSDDLYYKLRKEIRDRRPKPLKKKDKSAFVLTIIVSPNADLRIRTSPWCDSSFSMNSSGQTTFDGFVYIVDPSQSADIRMVVR